MGVGWVSVGVGWDSRHEGLLRDKTELVLPRHGRGQMLHPKVICSQRAPGCCALCWWERPPNGLLRTVPADPAANQTAAALPLPRPRTVRPTPLRYPPQRLVEDGHWRTALDCLTHNHLQRHPLAFFLVDMCVGKGKVCGDGGRGTPDQPFG